MSGHFEYRNWNLSLDKPLSFSRVEIKDYPGNVLGAVFTNINGDFTFPIDVPPSGIYIQCYVYTKNDYVTVLKGASGVPYSDSTGFIFVQPGENKTINKVFPDNYPEHGFTVFSYHTGLNKGWYYLNGTTAGPVLNATARYPYGQILPGYDDTLREIWLPTYTYQYQDEILHEYGHYAMHAAFNWWMPPNYISNHTIRKVTNQPTALTEGWAYFFSLAVKGSGTYVQQGVPNTDFESPTWRSPGWPDGDVVEGRVAGAFWDIYDSLNDGYDTFTDGFNNIWTVFNTMNFSTFNHFWQLWYDYWYFTTPPARMAIFQNSIDYRNPGDADGNDTVNIFDISIVGLAFGVGPSDPHWDERADLVRDDWIDIFDIVTVAVHFGYSYG